MKSGNPASMSKAWMAVGLLFVVAVLNYLDRSMITTMRVSVLKEIPMSEAQFGLLTSAFLWVYGLLSPLAGYIADRFDRKKVILSSLFVWSAVTWLTSKVQTFDELLMTRVLMGVSEAFYVPAALAMISEHHGKSTRSLATGLHQAGLFAGQSLGFVGGMLADTHSWTTAFDWLGVFGMAYAGVLILLLSNPPKAVPATHSEPLHLGRGLASMFRAAPFRRALTYWSLMGIVSWLVAAWLPTYYLERFDLTQTRAGLFATAYLYPLSFAGVIAGGYIADRWTRRHPRGRILLPVVGMLIGAPFIFLATFAPVLPVAALLFSVYAFTRAFCDANMMPILCMIVDDRYRATAYGIFNLTSTVIGGLAIYAGGILRDAKIDLTHIYQFAAATMLFCAWMLYRVRPMARPETEN
jgi:MFS family permease